MYKALFGTSSEVLQDRSSGSTDDFVILDESESPPPQTPVSAEKTTQPPAESPVNKIQGERVSRNEFLMAATPQEVSGQSQGKDSQDHNAKSSEKATQTEQHPLIPEKLEQLSSESSERENPTASDEHSEDIVSTLSLSDPARQSSDSPRINSVYRTLTKPSTISRRSLPKPVTPVVTVTSKARPRIFEACAPSTTRAGSGECSEIQGKRNSGLLRPYGEGRRRERAASEIMLSDVQTIESLDIHRLESLACKPKRSSRPLTAFTMSRSIGGALKDTEIPESVNYRKAIRDRAERIVKEVQESARKARSRGSEPYFPPYQNEYYQDLCGLCHFPVPEYQPYTVELAGIFYHKRCVAYYLFSKKELRAALRARCEEKSRERAQPTRKCSLWQKVVKGFSKFFKAK